MSSRKIFGFTDVLAEVRKLKKLGVQPCVDTKAGDIYFTCYVGFDVEIALYSDRRFAEFFQSRHGNSHPAQLPFLDIDMLRIHIAVEPSESSPWRVGQVCIVGRNGAFYRYEEDEEIIHSVVMIR